MTISKEAQEAAKECMMLAYGYFNGGSAGSSEAMNYARENCVLPGLQHVASRFEPFIQRAIDAATVAKDARIVELEKRCQWHDYMNDAALIARIKQLESVLKTCTAKFRDYQYLHAQKMTTDSDTKAKTNQKLAEMCEEALNQTGGEPCAPTPKTTHAPVTVPHQDSQTQGAQSTGASNAAPVVQPDGAAAEQRARLDEILRRDCYVPDAESPNPHNPVNLTPEQVGISDGWRLLDEDEITGFGKQTVSIQCWFAGQWSTNACFGVNQTTTYRTRLSRAELRKARGLEQKGAQ